MTNDITEEEIKSLEDLLEYRSDFGLFFLIEVHEWDGPTLTIKVKGYDASSEFVAKYLSLMDDVTPRLLLAYKEQKYLAKSYFLELERKDPLIRNSIKDQEIDRLRTSLEYIANCAGGPRGATPTSQHITMSLMLDKISKKAREALK